MTRGAAKLADASSPLASDADCAQTGLGADKPKAQRQASADTLRIMFDRRFTTPIVSKNRCAPGAESSDSYRRSLPQQGDQGALTPRENHKGNLMPRQQS